LMIAIPEYFFADFSVLYKVYLIICKIWNVTLMSCLIFCLLLQIVTKFNHSLTLNLRSDCGHGLHGTITVHAEESDSSRMAVEMTLHCLNLENKDMLSKSVWINFSSLLK
jgi:hypothetical protein